jgi:ABC-type antimicrobial peptide transport system permease subunit
LYGLLSFMVTRRTNEIGVRMALGARPRDAAWPVMRNALWLAAFGLLIGIPLALGLNQILRRFLFGVKPHDPVTIVASIILLLIIAAIAAWLPARRAAKVDPMEALRYE